MTDIDFIKWKIGYADGFRVVDDQIVLPNGMCETICGKLFTKNSWVTVWDPFLSQRAIEGLRGKYISVIEIEIENDDGGSMAYKPYLDEYTIGNNIYLSLDQAKEAALKYVYDKEMA